MSVLHKSEGLPKSLVFLLLGVHPSCPNTLSISDIRTGHAPLALDQWMDCSMNDSTALTLCFVS